MNMQHLTTINELNRKKVEYFIDEALKIKKEPQKFQEVLKGKVVATLFFEPSTRTRLSFEAAANRLGARVIGFSDPKTASYGAKGESLEDTIQVIQNFADVIVMRHPENGAAKRARKVAKVPIINAGDGTNEHPSQTLLDLTTIYETQRKIDGIKIGFVADLNHQRGIRSLSIALSLFKNIEVFYISPKKLGITKDVKSKINGKVKYSESEKFDGILKELDILYVTRVAFDKFEDQEEADKYIKIFKEKYKLTTDMLTEVKENFKILHIMPRKEEIEIEVDKTPYAYYFDQVGNGMYVRMAILKKLLG
jgi:aspartate carbamoyltransferase catalytic subunit